MFVNSPFHPPMSTSGNDLHRLATLLGMLRPIGNGFAAFFALPKSYKETLLSPTGRPRLSRSSPVKTTRTIGSSFKESRSNVPDKPTRSRRWPLN